MKTVLIVDDEFDLTGTLRAILETSGYHAETCFNGKQALQQLEKQAHPDLVLLDLMMPVMSGLEVLREMQKSHLGHIPVILMSSAPPRIERTEYKYRSLLRKPFTMKSLLASVEEVLGRPEG